MSRFTIFGRPSCGYCVRAKQLLDEKGYKYRWVDIVQEGISKADLEKTIGQPVQTVPQIFDGTDYVGGYTELEVHVDRAA